MSTDLGPLDVLGIIENNCGYDELLPNVVEIEYQGHTLLVLSLESMVDMKKTAHIPEDEYRLKIFEETLKQIKDQ